MYDPNKWLLSPIKKSVVWSIYIKDTRNIWQKEIFEHQEQPLLKNGIVLLQNVPIK